MRPHHKQTRIRTSHGSTDDSIPRETDSCLADKQYLVYPPQKRKGKRIKFALEQAMKAQGGNTGIAILFL
jgi:hypothetical protein